VVCLTLLHTRTWAAAVAVAVVVLTYLIAPEVEVVGTAVAGLNLPGDGQTPSSHKVTLELEVVNALWTVAAMVVEAEGTVEVVEAVTMMDPATAVAVEAMEVVEAAVISTNQFAEVEGKAVAATVVATHDVPHHVVGMMIHLEAVEVMAVTIGTMIVVVTAEAEVEAMVAEVMVAVEVVEAAMMMVGMAEGPEAAAEVEEIGAITMLATVQPATTSTSVVSHPWAVVGTAAAAVVVVVGAGMMSFLSMVPCWAALLSPGIVPPWLS
jgi:hypothetical protein